MICYTLSDCVLKNMNNDKEIFTRLLIVFSQNKPHKVVVDRAGKIIDIYKALISNDNFIFEWLRIMTDYLPKSWEYIEVDNIEKIDSKEEIFLEVCSRTESKLLIVYSHNDWAKGKKQYNRNILYKDKLIRIFDKDDAIKFLDLTVEKARADCDKYNAKMHKKFQQKKGVSKLHKKSKLPKPQLTSS